MGQTGPIISSFRFIFINYIHSYLKGLFFACLIYGFAGVQDAFVVDDVDGDVIGQVGKILPGQNMNILRGRNKARPNSHSVRWINKTDTRCC